MSQDRQNPFSSTMDLPTFEVKPKSAQRRTVAREHIDSIARQEGFPSREPVQPKQPAVRQRNKSRRTEQLNFRATHETVERFYGVARRKDVPLWRVLELALDALDTLEQQSSDGASVPNRP